MSQFTKPWKDLTFTLFSSCSIKDCAEIELPSSTSAKIYTVVLYPSFSE